MSWLSTKVNKYSDLNLEYLASTSELVIPMNKAFTANFQAGHCWMKKRKKTTPCFFRKSQIIAYTVHAAGRGITE